MFKKEAIAAPAADVGDVKSNLFDMIAGMANILLTSRVEIMRYANNNLIW